ncbi:uncharacterized protein LOC144452312 [Glandiceps talaboti]
MARISILMTVNISMMLILFIVGTTVAFADRSSSSKIMLMPVEGLNKVSDNDEGDKRTPGMLDLDDNVKDNDVPFSVENYPADNLGKYVIMPGNMGVQRKRARCLCCSKMFLKCDFAAACRKACQCCG